MSLRRLDGLDHAMQEVAPLNSEDSLGWALLRLTRYTEHALREVDLTASQYVMLCMIAKGPLSPTDLAKQSNVSGPSATMMLRGLFERGLVKRRASSTDQRRVWVTLTKRGGELLEKANERIESRLVEVASHFPNRTDAPRALKSLVSWNLALDRFRPGWLSSHPQPLSTRIQSTGASSSGSPELSGP